MVKQSGKTQNFKFKCDDTDVFVLLFYSHVTQISLEPYCWSLWKKDDHWHSLKKTAEKHRSVASCLQAMYVLTGRRTVPMMFGIGKVSALNFPWKNPLNYLGNLGALPKVIAVETNTFAARVLRCQEFCGHGWNKVFELNKVYTLISLNKQDIGISPHPSLLILTCVWGSQLFIYLWQVLILLFYWANDHLRRSGATNPWYCIKWLQSPFAYYNFLLLQNVSRKKQMCMWINCMS